MRQVTLMLLFASFGCDSTLTFKDLEKGKHNVDKAEIAAINKLIAGTKAKKDNITVHVGIRAYHSPSIGIDNKHITSLKLSNLQIKDMSAVAKLKHLRYLDLGHNNITKLDGIKKLDNLLDCIVVNNKIAAVAPGAGARLRMLDLRRNKLTTLSGIQDMPKLSVLKLGKNPIKSTRGLENLPYLRRLSVQSKQLEEVAGISKMPNLKELWARYANVSKVALSDLPALEMLYLDQNKIGSLDGLGNLPKLKILSVPKNKITALPKKRFPNLQMLKISNNKLASLDGIENYPKLVIVRAKHNQLTSLAPLAKIHKRIVNIEVDYNKLKTLASLSGQVSAEQMPAEKDKRKRRAEKRRRRAKPRKDAKAASPQIRYVSTKLTASHNQIADLRGLELLPRLKTLDLSGNKLKNLDGIKQHPMLVELLVPHNQLTTLSGATTLPKLKVLIAHHNKLGNKEEAAAVYTKRGTRYRYYDLRHNLYVGVAAAMLYYGVSRSGRYVVGGYRRRTSVRSGSRGSRYSRGGGGYRYGK
jgi:Leucine-rich repeat (LRR) protein